MKLKRRKNPEKEVAAWNAKVGVGDTVEYRGYPEAKPQTFTTRTPAEVLSGHTAVVWLNGKSGCVCVDACRKIVARAAPQKPMSDREWSAQPAGIREGCTAHVAGVGDL